MAAFDKIRDKWESISPRERRMVVLLGVSFVVVMVLYVALAIKDGLDALEAKNAQARTALQRLTAYRATAKAPVSNDPVAAIPQTPVKLESYIYNAGTTAKITVPGVNPRTPTTKGGFTVHSAAIEIRDLTITQVKDFLEAIETQSTAVAVTSLTLKRNFRDQEKMDLSAEISTYSKAAETTDDKGKGKGSGSGSDKAGG
jgi:general secretion pathway protein M